MTIFPESLTIHNSFPGKKQPVLYPGLVQPVYKKLPLLNNPALALTSENSLNEVLEAIADYLQKQKQAHDDLIVEVISYIQQQGIESTDNILLEQLIRTHFDKMHQVVSLGQKNILNSFRKESSKIFSGLLEPEEDTAYIIINTGTDESCMAWREQSIDEPWFK